MVVRARISVKSFEMLSPELGPCELERGEVIPLAPGGMDHSGISFLIAFFIAEWARKTKRGRVFSNESGLVTETDPDTVRGIDAAYYSYKRLPRGKRPAGFSTVPPELAVEVIGKGQGWRKMIEKANEYLRMGVDRVWIVDPAKRRVHVIRPDDEPTVFSERQTISDPKILPGFRCRVSGFFED